MVPLFFGTILFIAISFTIFLLWAVRGVMRPLRRFATTVDEFTVDGAVTLLEENGPSELRGAARALNRMRERVKAMLEQRTQMLAAISHDLRTPITRMRLRAEFIELKEVREPILRDIEQMDAMVHSAMSFIRDGIPVQRTSLLDLSTLVQTVCDEFVDMGHSVTYETPGPTSINGNSDELYRAVVNLVSNAVRFGTDVRVDLRRADHSIEIDVSDDGPGIPADQKEGMLAPFARGDAARPIENLQGFGLGLPIVQAIVRAHKGALTLLDRSPHGLIARISLPCRTMPDAMAGA
jgi:signal transduction histidine kinase